MKRIGIFVFYDKDGLVDAYVEYFLEALSRHIEKLVIVCNGVISDNGLKCLKQFSDDIFIRENSGYDAMAYKLAMTAYISWEVLEKYDELMLINDTFYGPLYPLENVFNEMDQRICDFWGLTSQNEYIDYYYENPKVLPAYIQSYFTAFRKSVFMSNVFQNYWNNFDSTGWIFSDVVNKHERFFTQYLEQAGFVWDTYVHATEYDERNPKHSFVQYYHAAYQLIKDYKCPMIKKKKFASKHLLNNPGELGDDAAKALLWIAENTEYDVDMIWENILRLYNMKDLQNSLNLNYIISEKKGIDNSYSDKAVTLTYIKQPFVRKQMEYIHILQSYMEIHGLEELNFRNTDVKTSDYIVELLNENTDYQYILLLIGVESKQKEQTALRMYSAIEEQWGNLVGSSAYTEGIIDLFMKNKRLGVLSAPFGIHGSDFGRSPEQKLQGCMALWCRKNIFLKMSETWTDFFKNPYEISMAALHEQYVNLAQKMGYYSAVGMKSVYAAMAYANMDEMLHQIEKHAKSKYEFHDFGSYLDGDMFLFCERYPRIYIYGAGDNGSRVAELLVNKGIHVSGFIVSDNQLDFVEKHGYPIYRLSEIEDSLNQAGIVVSVTNRKFQTDILYHLRQRGFKNVYLLDT